MKGLIVAGIATAAGVAGVVGISAAMDDGAPSAPAVSVAPASRPDALAGRLARVRRAERLADEALARAAAAAPPPSRVYADAVDRPPAAAPTSRDDDDGEDLDHDRGRGDERRDDD
jgi:hypothetical protein